MAHTQGKWEVCNNIGKKGEIGIVADEAPCIIAIMGNSKEWPEEAKTNARLIAAAPLLLEACKAFMDCIGKNGYYPQAGKPKTDKLRQAIAAAEAK